MSRKKKMFIKRTTSVLLSLALLETTIPGTPAKAGENRSRGGRSKTYIMVMDGRKATKAVEQKIDGDALEENESLAENNVLVAELTEGEAAALQREEGVLFVEEDFDIETNGVDAPVPTDEEEALDGDGEEFWEGMQYM